jgi:hypothetical protein
MNEELEFYAVQNTEGKYFRRKGYGGYGESWVDDLKSARIFPKIGGARAVVTFWSELDREKKRGDPNYKEFGTPNLIVLTISKTRILNEEERIQKRQKKVEEALKRKQIKKAKINFEDAKREYAEATGI